MFCMLKKKKIHPAYVSKYNSNHEKQAILLMISNGEIREQWETLATQAKSEGQWWNYVAVKKLSALLSGITSKHHGYFYYLNCLHSFATEKELNHIKKYVNIKIFATS